MHVHIHTDSVNLPQTALAHFIKLGNNCCTQRSTVTVYRETSTKVFQILSVTLNLTSSFIKLKLMLELPEMNVQTPLQSTKQASETASQL